MNNTSNRPFGLSKPPTEDFIRVVRELDAITTRLAIPFLLVGAAARDIVLVNLWGQPPGRATADIDFAFAVNDWAEFAHLRDGLVATGHFQRVPHKEQCLKYTDPEHGFQLPVDFIPFRGVASKTQTISWPPEGDFVMNVAGFEETLAAALCIELEPGLVISVASLPGLAILKMVAWADRHLENNKDAADLYRILSTFDSAGNQDRIFNQELELLESVDYDLTLAGARLLGRDAARIADSAAASQIVNLFNSDTQVNLLISHMITTASYEENAASVARILDCFRRGYLEAMPESRS
jgi:predicted nucleotidyltransferase